MSTGCEKISAKFEKLKNKYPNRPRKIAAVMAWQGLKLVFQTPPSLDISYKTDGAFHMACHLNGGIGDVTMAGTYLKELYKYMDCPVLFHVFTTQKPEIISRLFDRIPYIASVERADAYDENKFDACLEINRFPRLILLNESKAAALPTHVQHLFQTLLAFEKENPKFFNHGADCDTLSVMFSLINKQVRMTQADVGGLLKMSPQTKPLMVIAPESESVLRENNLIPGQYITVQAGVDMNYNGKRNLRIWPLKYYDALCKKIKETCPHLKIVQLGGVFNPALTIKNTDLNLSGQTTFDELKVLLKHSRLHIDGDCGMVHINHCLMGKSAVFFGQTLPAFLGYPENINLKAPGVCPLWCEWVQNTWAEKCVCGHTEPPCMTQLTPDFVFDKIKPHLTKAKNQHSFHLRTDEKTRYKKGIVFGALDQKMLSRLREKTAELTYYTLDLDQYTRFKNNIPTDFADLSNIPEQEESIDVIYYLGTDETALHSDGILRECLRVLAPNGHLVILNQNMPYQSQQFDILIESGDTVLQKKDISPAAASEKNTVYESTRRLHFIHAAETLNAGDSVACPYHHFKYFRYHYPCFIHDIRHHIRWQDIRPDDIVILGGGGLFECREDFQDLFQKLFEITKHVVAWGVGHNLHYDRTIQTQIDFDKFALLSVRDYNYQNQRYVPDVSCMRPDLSGRYKITRDIGVIEHLDYPINDFSYDKISNAYDVNYIIHFIGTSQSIITNSYHIVYWATLMGKKVILYKPFSNKFDYFKYPPVIYSGNLAADLKAARIYPDALQECRDLNIAFFKDVQHLIHQSLG